MEFIYKLLNKEYEENKKEKYIPIKLKVGILISVFFIGFLFFITSNFWLVTKSDFNSNKIYDTLTVSNDISLKLRRWSYNPTTKQTEIEIGKNFSSVNDDLKFNLNVFSNGTNFINANVDYESPNLLIISIGKLPFNTKYIKLEFSVQIGKETYGSSFNMDLKSDEIEIDTNLKLHKSKEEYLHKSISYEIEKFKEIINENENIIKKSKISLEEYNKELNAIQENKSTNATKEELEILSKKINNLNQEIIKLNDLIEQKTKENISLDSDIKVLQSKLDEK